MSLTIRTTDMGNGQEYDPRVVFLFDGDVCVGTVAKAYASLLAAAARLQDVVQMFNDHAPLNALTPEQWLEASNALAAAKGEPEMVGIRLGTYGLADAVPNPDEVPEPEPWS